MHSHVCMAELLYMKDFSQIEKKYRAAPAKYGTVGLIIWHSRSYNKSMISIKISGRSCGGSCEALRKFEHYSAILSNQENATLRTERTSY